MAIRTDFNVRNTTEKFEDMKGIPWVVGAIDGKHIPIKAPIENPNKYINRKLFPSIQFENQICLFQLKI